MSNADSHESYIRWFEDIGMGDLPSVGGKNASLGEMYRELSRHGVRVPNGFAITAAAYWHFLETSGALEKIKPILRDLKPGNIDDLTKKGMRLRQLIVDAKLPADLEQEIAFAYSKLEENAGTNIDVAVRSSATAEDLPDASFAGQQESYLNVRGVTDLFETCRRCFASLFTNRAISYRTEHGFDHLKVALSIGVQQMVRSDLACSGVMFSIDTESGFRDAVLINASYGLGENIVQGLVNPDEFYVFKPTLREGYEPIIQKRVGTKEFKLIYDTGGSKRVKNIPVPVEERVKLALTDEELLKLANWACRIEDHYTNTSGHFTPMDIEWAKDGRSGEIFIVQARPETVQSRKHWGTFDTFELKEKGKVLLTGRSVGERIGQGPVRVIKRIDLLDTLQEGEVLVTEKTDPDWEPYLKRVKAIVTDQGGRTCHAAIVSRELGLPAVVGTGTGTGELKDGQLVTVSCAEGEEGSVYEGLLKFEKHSTSLAEVPRPKTRIMLNLANPEIAFHQSFIPNDGVGLTRMEFIISNTIKAHPMALIEYDKIEDKAVRAEIDRLTEGYTDRPQYFVDKLAEGISMIAAAFYPKDVIVRFSDFKTNEYSHLLGGSLFEPSEENPMLGFRGASRYYHPLYRKGFALECKAIRKVRETMGLANVKVMIPFCRTTEEAEKVLAEMKGNGLVRGEHGLEVYLMCEIPSNVLLAKEFALLVDGFSIGSNDLTQLVLGVDRDSSLVAPLFDERNPAVKQMLATAIRTVKAQGKKIGICGQAPSDYPEITEFLVAEGIDSISLNPDAAIRMSLIVQRMETERSIMKPR